MSNKPSCFVGSSSESLRVAEAVQRNLSPYLDVSLWTQIGFELNKSTLHTLLREVRRHDFAIFVFAADDVIRLRKATLLSTRDNVMFELGMFIATLGPERCFFMIPETNRPFRIPSDIAGLTAPTYNPDGHNGNIDAALGAACSKVADAVRNQSKLSGQWELYITGSQHTDPNGSMLITCGGERAAARLLLRKSNIGESVKRDFRYEGRYASGQFALTFEQSEADDQIIGSMVLRANAERTQLKGQTVYWHHDRAQLVTTEFLLKRCRGE